MFDALGNLYVANYFGFDINGVNMQSRLGAAVTAFTIMALMGCSGTTQSNITPTNPSLLRFSRPKPLLTEAVLYSFCSTAPSCQDGLDPEAGLTNVNGTLYGTTLYGGDRGHGSLPFGTVFSITTGGTYRQLYSFAGPLKDGPDGEYPQAGLTYLKGTLYGTTTVGGTSGDGTIFSITKSGAYSQLHSFTGSDGANPDASLINVDGTLYGTTQRGGANGHGTVFAITESGAYNLLFSFASGGKDGCPNAGLTNVSGVLYGTTSGCNRRNYYGTVFKITTSGAETLLYHFAGGSDGAEPLADLTRVGGVLYGTTSSAGAYSHGTVFKITTAGTETVLYSFKGGTDGAQPRASLTNVRGTLYGTTFFGGAAIGAGTVFKITTSGTETVLYRFAGKPDGLGPAASLANVGGTLYSTTGGGGEANGGTVFSLSGF